MNNRLILASASQVRARLLKDAGVVFDIVPSTVDEDRIKQELAGQDPLHIAESLAAAKAEEISAANPGAFVIGADQMLECYGRLFDKPLDMEGARGHLQALAGQTHRLLTATVIIRSGDKLWSHTETPSLTMRPMSDAAIENYLSSVGDRALTSVGAYQLEGLGAQLFERVDGNFFSILGLPLLPLLAFLRRYALIPD
ncbi:MAG: Maf family nucleotide pyrophosphatase [Alphaproteobacteria bacterium]